MGLLKSIWECAHVGLHNDTPLATAVATLGWGYCNKSIAIFFCWKKIVIIIDYDYKCNAKYNTSLPQ